MLEPFSTVALELDVVYELGESVSVLDVAGGPDVSVLVGMSEYPVSELDTVGEDPGSVTVTR